jgi:tetratricopeptide (TPR) repeat protein
MILGQDAGVRGDPAAQQELYAKLVAAYPDDERAHMVLGGFHFGRQEYPQAIAEYEKTIAINPAFSQAYNQLGYAHRFGGDYAAAERAFKRYIELIPDDPNPYDSYAELLMKAGRYQESIDNYKKALALDRYFIASYVGIAHDQIFMGRGDDARATLATLTEVARNNGERRQALLWTAASYVHEGDAEKALAAVRAMAALADQDRDPASRSGDLTLIGQIQLDAGRAGEAQASFAAALAAIEGAQVPAEVKENVRRNGRYFDALVALHQGDVAGARSHADAYRTAVEVARIPFEVWRVHELAGRIALAEKKFDAAATELGKANRQNPRVLFLQAKALEKAGKTKQASDVLRQVADFNQLGFDYAFVRDEAREKLENKS